MALLLIAAPAWGQSIGVPATVQIDQPGMIVIRATEFDCDATAWWSHGGIQQFPPDVLTPKPGVFVGFCSAPGVYKIGVIAAKSVNGKAVLSLPQTIIVTVGGVPPVPTPSPVPSPTDPLTAQIEAAYTADPSPTKAADLVKLAATYTAMAAQIAGISTGNTLFTVMQAARNAQIGTRLAGIRGVLGQDLQTSTLPADGTATLTPAQQTAIAARLNYYAQILGGIK